MKKPLDQFEIATCTPFNVQEADQPLAQAYALLVFMSNAFALSDVIGDGKLQSTRGGYAENFLRTMNQNLVAEALNGIGTLVALGAAFAEEEAPL